MSTLKTHNLQSPDAGSVNVALAPNAGMVVSGISTFSNNLIANTSVGIGTDNPASDLHINSAVPTIRFTDSDTSQYSDILQSGHSLYISGDRGSSGSGGIIFRTQGTNERLRIDSGGRVLIGSSSNNTDDVGDSALQVHTLDDLHPAIRVNSTSNNGYTMFGDAYQADESQVNIGVSHSSSSLVLSQGCKVNISSDDAYVSSQDTYSTKPNVLRLDSDGSLSFLNTNTSATTTTDSAVTLYERLKITSTGDVGIGYNSPPCKLAIRDTTEFTAYGGGAPNSSNILLQLWNNPPNETENDHASMQFAVNGGTHNRVNTISAVAESASNRKLAFAFCTDEAGSRTEKMRIHGDGYVTKPETPSWVLRPSYSSNQTLGGGTHAVGWSSSDYNTHAKAVRLHNVTLSGSGFGSNLHNGQTYGKINVPVAGIYRVWCTIRMENNPTTGNLFLYVDGSQVVRQHVEMWNHRPYMHGRIEHIVNLNANSYIIWALNCNGGVVSGVQDTVNWCGGHLIG